MLTASWWPLEVVNSVGRGSAAQSDGHSCLAGSLFSGDKHGEALHAEPVEPVPLLAASAF